MRAAVGNRRLVRFTATYFATTLAEWALFVGALVYAIEHGGASAAGFASIALLVPTAITAPLAGVIADRRPPHRVRLAVHLTQSAAFTVAAIGAAAGAPVALVIACCAVVVSALTFVRPACAVLVPGMVRTTSELTVANVWLGYCDSISTLGGPLLATALLATGGPPVVFVGCAVLTTWCALATLLHLRAETPRLAHVHVHDRDVWGSARRSIDALRHRPGATGVMAVAASQYVLLGALDLLLVVLAIDALDMGHSGAGVLTTAFGVGAAVCAVVSALLVRRALLAPLLFGSLAIVAVAMIVLGAAPSVTVALLLLPLIGFGRSLLSLTSRMLLQRSAPHDSLAAVFAALELFAGIAMVIGSVTAQVLIAAGGVEAALIGLGAFFFVVLVATRRALHVADESADIPIVAISLLRGLPAFAPLPPFEIETVARVAVEVPIAPGERVVVEGDEGDRFYAVVDGELDVTMNGRPLRTLQRGDGFGEVALLGDVRRTATVTARSHGTLLAIDHLPFIRAVAGTNDAQRAAWSVIRDLEFDDEVRPDFDAAP